MSGYIKLELYDEQDQPFDLDIDLDTYKSLVFKKELNADNPNEIYNYITSMSNMRIRADLNAIAENFSQYDRIIGFTTTSERPETRKYLVRIENWRKYHYFYPVLIAVIESMINEGAAYVPPYGYEFFEDEDPYSDVDSSYSSSNDGDRDDEAYFGGFNDEEESDDSNDESDSDNDDDNETRMVQNAPVARRQHAPKPFESLPRNLPTPKFTSTILEKYISYKPPVEKKMTVCLDSEASKREREQEPAFASQKQCILKEGLTRHDIEHFYRDNKNKVMSTVVTVFEARQI
jgi:hypothetical protein